VAARVQRSPAVPARRFKPVLQQLTVEGLYCSLAAPSRKQLSSPTDAMPNLPLCCVALSGGHHLPSFSASLDKKRDANGQNETDETDQ